jgi:hypothetical protein
VGGVTGFLVEIYAPRTSALADDSARARRAAEAVAREGVAIRYIRSILVPEDETWFHLFEAQSAEAVERVVERAALRPGRIVEAVQ